MNKTILASRWRRKMYRESFLRQVPGSLVPSVKYIQLPNQKGPNANGHSFGDNQQPLANAIADWLQQLDL